MTKGKFVSCPIPIKPPNGEVRWRKSGTCDECGSWVELYCLEDGTLGRHGCQCCEFVSFYSEVPSKIEQIGKGLFMLRPYITPADFNALTSSIEHDDWLNGVEIGHDGELVSIDTPWAMGLEETPIRWKLYYNHCAEQIFQARKLVIDTRIARDWGCTPIISIEEGGLEYLANFWPRFMFSRTEKKMEKGSIAWVKRLLRFETKDTTVTILLPNNLQTGFIGEQILEKSAIPIDGVWVSCSKRRTNE